MAPMPAALRENEGKTPCGEDHRVLPVPPVHLGFSLRQVASGFHGRSRPPRRFPHPPSFSSAHPTVTLVRSFTHSLALSLSLSFFPILHLLLCLPLPHPYATGNFHCTGSRRLPPLQRVFFLAFRPRLSFPNLSFFSLLCIAISFSFHLFLLLPFPLPRI